MQPSSAVPNTQLNPIRKWAWGYAILFLGVVSLGYIPAFIDDHGALFGLFHIELKDDILHLASAVWAALAAMASTRASIFYFRLFGVVYALDGICGLLFGNGYLDFGIFQFGPVALDWATKIGANTPHILIGGIAVFLGFVASRWYAHQA